MDWLCQDWEHEALKDDVYLMEARIQMEHEWQQWEEEQAANKKPAIIKVVTPIKHEVKRNTSAIRGAFQEGL